MKENGSMKRSTLRMSLIENIFSNRFSFTLPSPLYRNERIFERVSIPSESRPVGRIATSGAQSRSLLGFWDERKRMSEMARMRSVVIVSIIKRIERKQRSFPIYRQAGAF
jgi:hypothetical protein